MANKTIKMLKPWSMHAIGAELSMPAPIADLLIQRGRAEPVADIAPKGKRAKSEAGKDVRKQ